VPFRSAPPTIAVDPRQGFQVMEGFGASITDSSAAVLYRLDRRTRDRAMAALFRTDGLSYLRQPMGASDFVDEPHYTYDDNDIAARPPGESPETEYAADLLSRPQTARWLAGTAFHCYSGDPIRQTQLHDAFPAKDVYFTECSGSHGESDTPAQIFAGTLGWHARNLIIGTTRNWAKTVVNWNLALDPAGGPHNGGCGTCTGVITVGPGNRFTTDAEFYTLGHAARFVRPGAVRIASSGEPPNVAFRNRDGSIAVIVLNDGAEARTVAVGAGGRSASYTLPAGALATFVWR
jgi:glucosylceramidase